MSTRKTHAFLLDPNLCLIGSLEDLSMSLIMLQPNQLPVAAKYPRVLLSPVPVMAQIHRQLLIGPRSQNAL